MSAIQYSSTDSYNAARYATLADAIAAAGTDGPVDLPAGSWTVSSTVTVSCGVRGKNFPYASTQSRTALVPNITGGTPILDRVNSDGADIENLFLGDPSNTTASSIASTANCIGLRLGRPGSTPATSYKVGRSKVRNILAYGMTGGIYVQGWTSDLESLHVVNNGLGFYGDYLNGCKVDLRCSGNLQDFRINNSIGLKLTTVFESTNVASVASTIDGCHSIEVTAAYTEHATTSRTDYLLKIGTSTQVTNLVMHISASGIFSTASGYCPILLDRVKGGRIYIEGNAGDMHSVLKRTANCRDVKVYYVPTRGVWPLDNAVNDGPAFEYFPNRSFDVALRGFYNVTMNNVTPTWENIESSALAIVRRGKRALRITASASTNNYVEFQLSANGSSSPSPTCTALRRKRIRVGAWVWIPNLDEFDEADLSSQEARTSIYAYSYDGSTTVNSDDTSSDSDYPTGSYNHHTVRSQWNFIWCELDVQSTCNRIGVVVYLNQGGTLPDNDAYIVIDSIHMCEATVGFDLFMDGALPDAPCIDAVNIGGGNLRIRATGKPTDTDQSYADGDEIALLDPASATSGGWTCTTAGAGGSALWAAWAAPGVAAT